MLHLFLLVKEGNYTRFGNSRNALVSNHVRPPVRPEATVPIHGADLDLNKQPTQATYTKFCTIISIFFRMVISKAASLKGAN